MTGELDPYLLGLVLDRRQVVVVGGGAVTERRIVRLTPTGARIRLIAPDLTEGLRARADAGEVEWLPRRFAPADLEDAWFVLAATDDPATNAEVAAEAERRRIFCVRADDASGGSARTPATAAEQDMLVGVLSRHTSGHGDPGRIRTVRDALAVVLRDLTADAR